MLISFVHSYHIEVTESKEIEDFWSTVTPEKCRKYIGHIQRVLPVVVEGQGKASGF